MVFLTRRLTLGDVIFLSSASTSFPKMVSGSSCSAICDCANADACAANSCESVVIDLFGKQSLLLSLLGFLFRFVEWLVLELSGVVASVNVLSSNAVFVKARLPIGGE